MRDLRKLWEIGGLIEDTNNDNVPDAVNVSLSLNEQCLCEGLVDFCARMGFETTSLSFDFLHKNENYEHRLEFIPSDETSMTWKGNTIRITYDSSKSLSEFLKFIAAKWHRNFDDNLEPVYVLTVRDGMVVSKNNAWPLSIENNVQQKEIVYNIKSLTDFWNDTGFLHGKEAKPLNEQSVTFRIDEQLSDNLNIWQEICYGAARIGMESTSLQFPLTGSYSNNPLKFHFKLTRNNTEVFYEDNNLYFIGEQTSLVKAIAYFFREKHWSVGGHFGIWELPYQRLSASNEVLFQDTWNDAGEVKELYDHIDNLSLECETDSVDFNIFVSEPINIRHQIKDYIRSKYPHATVNVRSSFKPGFFWIVEEVLPQLQQLEHLNRISIQCLKDEQQDGLELPIRWIQEIYPIDEILAKELDIADHLIDFELVESLESTYVLLGFDSEDNCIFKSQIDIPVSKVPYVDNERYSYPTTSFFAVTKNGEPVKNEMIITDRERFYTYYMNNIVPKLWEKVQTKDLDSGFLKPFFDRIEIKVEMSEAEYKLPVMEERISSLEALHEDLYFNTLDYFLQLGEQRIGKGYTAPGGVFPFLKVSEGCQPKAHIKVYEWKDQEKVDVITKKLIFTDNIYPTSVEYKLSNSHERYEVQPPQKPYDITIKNHELYPQKAPIRQWLVDFSYRGEPIFAYELFSPVNEKYYSAIKMSQYKPTVLIETGHHGNEVSSMPAVVELLDDIYTNYPHILENINIIAIPCANPDGVKLHQQMVKDNPEWKHHAARYNAVGLEFSDVRFKDSIFGEANVLPKILNKWAPDIIIDNHGIPSHEWTQPFAGYHISPRWDMSFWIPNSMLYGIARKLDEADYPQHAKVLKKIIHSIQQKVKGSTVHRLNQYWISRYKKYGHRFMPDMFPLELVDQFIFYQWPTETDVKSINAISRFPDWVSADILSEVADETVYDETLEICKKAQRTFNLGAIEWIERDKQSVELTYSNGNISRKRERPLNL